MHSINIQQMQFAELMQNLEATRPSAAGTTTTATKNDKLTLMIGQTEKKKGITAIFAYDTEKAVYLHSTTEGKGLENYEYHYNGETLTRNKQQVLNNPKGYIQRLLREFRENNEKIKVVKVATSRDVAVGKGVG